MASAVVKAQRSRCSKLADPAGPIWRSPAGVHRLRAAGVAGAHVPFPACGGVRGIEGSSLARSPPRAHDKRQRGAELVADVGEERRLGTVRSRTVLGRRSWPGKDRPMTAPRLLRHQGGAEGTTALRCRGPKARAAASTMAPAGFTVPPSEQPIASAGGVPTRRQEIPNRAITSVTVTVSPPHAEHLVHEASAEGSRPARALLRQGRLATGPRR